MNQKSSKNLVPIIITSCVLFFAGYFSASFVEASTPAKVDLSKFWEASAIMKSHYPFKEKAPKLSEQIDGAISGLVASYGDPYTTYLSKTQLHSLLDSVQGSFSGIGIEVGMKDGLMTVITPIKGSPAEKAGFLPGDIIYKVQGKDVSDLNIDEIIQQIRGPKGTIVSIEVIRKGTQEPITFTPIRDKIAIPTTKSDNHGNVDVISLYTFTRESVEQMYNLLDASEKSNHDVVLDLRGNPGGLLDSAIQIGSMILPKGTVIVRERPGAEKGSKEDLFKSEGYNTIAPDTKIVVLLNQGSASASEILAGALQDQKRAVVVGAQSFGKGSVQEIIDLKDGSGIKVTIAKWYTPNNNSISDKGITPDILIEDTNLLDTNDEVLTRALEYMKTGK